MSATMTLKEIDEAISNGYKVKCYGNNNTGKVYEIDFVNQRGGFSFDNGCGLRQRELQSLFRRIKLVKPNLKIME